MNVDREEPLILQVICAWYGLSRLVLCQAWGGFLPVYPNSTKQGSSHKV